MMPYLETLAIFYKQIYNIDAYPLLLDSRRVQKIEELYDTLYNLAPAYSGFELYGMNTERVDALLEMIKQKPIGSLVLSTVHVDSEKIHSKTPKANYAKVSTIIAGFIRAGLHLRAFHSISAGVIDKFVNEFLLKHLDDFESDDFFRISRVATKVAAEIILAEKYEGLRDFTADDVVNKLEEYYLEGPEGWVKHSGLDYVSQFNTLEENAIELHRAHQGVTSVESKIQVKDPSKFLDILSLENLKEISDKILADPHYAYECTCKGNLCAIISNGTAVLGFGDMGAEPALPVMEGKSVLFKQLGGVDVMPICIREKDPQKVIDLIARFGNTFAAINLEDIKAPDCFEVERTLIDTLDIPVFHDDQHGTAVVCLAAFTNSLKLLNKKPDEVKIVINGGGAAGISICELLLEGGAKNIIVCDTKGAIYKGRKSNMNKFKDYIASITNLNEEKGELQDVLKGTDFFIGVSAAGALKPEWIKLMSDKPVIFALANPVPEIMPDVAKKNGAFIIATGRSDFKNQVNNSLVFPGLFRGAIDIRAKKITLKMKTAAAYGLAGLIKEHDLTVDHVIPAALDNTVPLLVSKKVAEAGLEENMARKFVDVDLVSENLKYFHIHGRFNYEKSLSTCSLSKAKL